MPRRKRYPAKTSSCQSPRDRYSSRLCPVAGEKNLPGVVLPLILRERTLVRSGGKRGTAFWGGRGSSLHCPPLHSQTNQQTQTEQGRLNSQICILLARGLSLVRQRQRGRGGKKKKQQTPESREQKCGLPVTFAYCDNSDVEQPNSWRCFISRAEFSRQQRVPQCRSCCGN